MRAYSAPRTAARPAPARADDDVLPNDGVRTVFANGHSHTPIVDMKTSPDNRWLATTDRDGGTNLWAVDLEAKEKYYAAQVRSCSPWSRSSAPPRVRSPRRSP